MPYPPILLLTTSPSHFCPCCFCLWVSNHVAQHLNPSYSHLIRFTSFLQQHWCFLVTLASISKSVSLLACHVSATKSTYKALRIAGWHDTYLKILFRVFLFCFSALLETFVTRSNWLFLIKPNPKPQIARIIAGLGAGSGRSTSFIQRPLFDTRNPSFGEMSLE